MPLAEPWAEAVVPARAALAGNPSDGYGGAVLALAFDNCSATAEASIGTSVGVEPPNELVRASVERFAREFTPAARGTAIRWRTAIPRAVGLGGSSAIVLAATQCLCRLHGISLDRADLAAFALAVETEELGIAAGLQDRVAQAYGGVTFMDFAGQGRYVAISSKLLPPLVVAWRADAGEDSGIVHSDLRERFAGGDPVVREAMAGLANLAHRARRALTAGDHVELARCADGSFDARERMLALDPRHVEMIKAARGAGAGANYAGSGGSIVCVCRDEDHQTAVIDALRVIGCEAIAPRVRCQPDGSSEDRPRAPRRSIV
jgi:glucuronokinase